MSPTVAVGACRQALVLAIDVSGSVNGQEYYQQINGLSEALSSPEIRQLILTGDPAVLSIAVFEWSSQNHQNLILPWTDMHTTADLNRAIQVIRTHPKKRQGLKTAIGRSLQFSSGLLSLRPECWQHTIDISVDGKNNAGPMPAEVYHDSAFNGITVNALVIGNAPSDTPVKNKASKVDLNVYFSEKVIRGSAAFTEVAFGYQDYARAMRRKLERELALPVFGALAIPRPKE